MASARDHQLISAGGIDQLIQLSDDVGWVAEDPVVRHGAGCCEIGMLEGFGHADERAAAPGAHAVLAKSARIRETVGGGGVVGHDDRGADDQLRLIEGSRRLEVIAIDRGRLQRAASVEVVSERETDPEHAGELGAVARRSQQVDAWVAGGHRRGAHTIPETCVGAPIAEQAENVDDISRELLDGRPGVAPTLHGSSGDLVASWGTADAEVDSPWIQRFEHRELLGNHEWCVVRQHDTTRTDGYPVCVGGQVRQEYWRRRARDRCHVVMFGHPEPQIAQRIGATRESGRGCECAGRGVVSGDDREIQDAERYTPTFTSGDFLRVCIMAFHQIDDRSTWGASRIHSNGELRMSIMDLDLDIDGLVQLAVSLLDGPNRSSAVIEHASPEQLIERFAEIVPLTVDGEVVAPHDLLAAVELVVVNSVRTSHPRFMNQNFAGPDPVAVVGDWIAAALNTIASTYEMAPVFTLMERELVTRLAALAGFTSLSSRAPGMFCAGGSLATIHALQLARHRRWPEGVATGFAQKPAVFVSDIAHYSTSKAASLLGMGAEAVYEVGVDDSGAMDVALLQAALEQATAAGRVPLAVVATAGTTVVGSFDPIEQIADVCDAHDLWLHVDGCFGGSALFSAEQRYRLDGSQRADSMVWNLHKMMGVTQQCSVLLVPEPDQLRECFSAQADYIFQTDKLHAEMDTGDETFMCGRRVDVLKLWLAWKARGDVGFAARIDAAVARADEVRDLIDASADLCPVGPSDFTTACVVWLPPEMAGRSLAELTERERADLHRVAPAAKAIMQREGTAMIGYQPVQGLNAFRLIFTNPEITPADVTDLVDLIRDASARAWAAQMAAAI